MASEIAAQQQQHLPHSDNVDSSSQDAPYDAPTMNGYVSATHDPLHHSDLQQGRPFFTHQERDESSPLAFAHADSFHSGHATISDIIEQAQDAPALAQPSVTETTIDTKAPASFDADLNPASPTPIEDVTSGIQPVSSFIPKDASNLSHPTPPPDEPLGTGEADVDMESPVAYVTEEVSASPAPPVESVPAIELQSTPSEPSLVRQREDDPEDEPAAKRSKVDEDFAEPEAPTLSTADAPMADSTEHEPMDQAAALISETVAAPSADVAPEPVVEPESALPSAEESAEPSSMDVETGTTQADTVIETQPEMQPPLESQVPSEVEIPTQPETQSPAEPEPQPADVAAESVEPSEPVGTITASPIEDKPTDPAATAETQPLGEAAASETKAKYSTEPMTTIQRSFLIDKTKNLKKTKNSGPFMRPVDHVALNIPTYPEIITNPMDLTTLETKLKEGKYGSVQDYVNDFELIINNTRRFNGDAHAVTAAGFSMQAYFNKMMETVPTADVVEPPKVQKKRSPSISREKPPRRESRAAAAPTAPAPQAAKSAPTTAQAPGDTYALQSDGTPQIRRQSSNRPARAIKPPQNREIPYAKPKRKEHQLELKFCEEVLKKIRSPALGHINHLFLQPVDPVALNIPNYHQVIKNPMDLGSMSQKLNHGQYATAAEFKKDFDLIIKNCLLFNPAGNPVRDVGIQLQRTFEAEWADKENWERKNQPSPNRGSSESGDDDSAADDEDDDDDDGMDDKARIRDLQRQLAEMQNAVSAFVGEKGSKSKKSKRSKSSSKKTSMSAAPKTKAPAKAATKPKKAKQVTYDEKQEISEAVGKMDDKQVQRLTEIITQNCAKYRDMEEMELEIDDLPNDVQVMLLDYVRRIFGNPNKKKVREPSPDDAAALDDDDFEPELGARGGKRKKHRPMGKKEQQDAIKNIQSKLAQFSQAATSGSESPTNSSFNATNVKDETSGDEESEESEEE